LDTSELAADVHGKRRATESVFHFPSALRVELKATAEQEKILQQARLERRDDMSIDLSGEQTALFQRAFDVEASRSRIVPMNIPKPGFRIVQSADEYFEIRDFYYTAADPESKDSPLVTYVDAIVVHVSPHGTCPSKEFLEATKYEIPLEAEQQESVRTACAEKKKSLPNDLTEAQIGLLRKVTGHTGQPKLAEMKLMSDDFNLHVVVADGESRYYTEWEKYQTCVHPPEGGWYLHETMLCKPRCVILP
jgi:hypothetical protein